MINDDKTAVKTCKRCRRVLPDLSGADYCPYCGAKQTTAPKRRRANGEGSVFKRPNGKYRVQLTEYRNGERITKTKDGFTTKAAAYAYISTLQNEQEKPQAVPTLREVFDAFISSHDRTRSTLNCYRAAVKAFTPLYNVPLDEITLEDLQGCIDDIEAGKRTKQNAKTIAGLIYKYAIPRYAALRQINLAQYLRIYDNSTGAERPAFTAEQLDAIRAQIGRTPGADIVYCHCYLGFRPSALLMLTPADYHPEHGGYFVGGIKTEAGRGRVVPIPAKIAPYIRPDKPFIFSLYANRATPIKDYRRAFYAVIEAAGIYNPVRDGLHLYTPHSCRHTYATLLKDVPGADRDKLELMGHTSTEQLLEYQSANLQELRRIVDALR